MLLYSATLDQGSPQKCYIKSHHFVGETVRQKKVLDVFTVILIRFILMYAAKSVNTIHYFKMMFARNCFFLQSSEQKENIFSKL